MLKKIPISESILTTHPEVASKWHPTKNALGVEYISKGSERNSWWFCEEHNTEWYLQPQQMTKNPIRGCLYCLFRGKSLADTFPSLAKEWHPIKNGLLTPEQVAPGSETIVWWLCANKHEWQSIVGARARKDRIRGCPYCSPRKSSMILREKSLQFTHPLVAKLWHPTKNILSPLNVTFGTDKKVWWQDEFGHEWLNRISHQVNSTGCPYCTGKRLLTGFNDLLTLHPVIASEWHPTKNGVLLPSEYMAGSDFKPWWLCKKGHEWRTKIGHRSSGQICPTCRAKMFSSEAEKELASFLGETFNTQVETNSRKVISPQEIDIYLPQFKVAIEFNGVYWHREENGKPQHYHREKRLACQSQGIRLLQVWEDDWANRKQVVMESLLREIRTGNLESKVHTAYSMTGLGADKAYEFYARHSLRMNKITMSGHLGLSCKGKLNAVISFSQNREILEVHNYASLSSSSEYLNILIEEALKSSDDEPATMIKIIVANDNETGVIYEKAGFFLDKELDPNYSYLFKQGRVKPDALEPEFAAKELHRIWDSGSTVYVKELS